MGTEEFSWADCHAVLSTLPYDSALHRAMDPKEWHWYRHEYDALVSISDMLQRIYATQERRPKIKTTDVPKPTVRPWDKKKTSEKIGGKPIALAEIDARLGW